MKILAVSQCLVGCVADRFSVEELGCRCACEGVRVRVQLSVRVRVR